MSSAQCPVFSLEFEVLSVQHKDSNLNFSVSSVHRAVVLCFASSLKFEVCSTIIVIFSVQRLVCSVQYATNSFTNQFSICSVQWLIFPC